MIIHECRCFVVSPSGQGFLSLDLNDRGDCCSIGFWPLAAPTIRTAEINVTVKFNKKMNYAQLNELLLSISRTLSFLRSKLGIYVSI